MSEERLSDKNRRIDEASGTETVGHEWDGIEELNTPLPRWWLWTFLATVVWGLGYTILYPAWPGLTGATAGTLQWSSRHTLSTEMADLQSRRAPIYAAIARTPVDQLPANAQLMQSAIEGGQAAFRVHCVQCHGTGAAGSKGYPNLNDDDWLWGGDMAAIEYTIVHGVRNPDHDETRISQMPAFGRDGILDATAVQDVVSHVRTLSGQERRSASSGRGAALFSANCAVCHGDAGTGNRTLGAPNLADAIWLYGGDRASLTQTITNSRQGVMPRWGHRLDPVTIRMLTAYVHSRGGGEATPAADAATPAEGAAPAL